MTDADTAKRNPPAAPVDLLGDDSDSLDSNFELAEANLREGRVRLVFFLEEAPMELRSIVDFLNRQMAAPARQRQPGL